MNTVFYDEKEKVQMDICYDYSYFEVFGLTNDEWYLTKKYYESAPYYKNL